MSARQLWLLTAAAFFTLLLWDLSGADQALASWAVAHGGFVWRGNPWAARFHDWGRDASAVALLWLLASVAFPTGVLRSLSSSERLWLLSVTIASMLMVSLLKRHSTTSCPWDLQGFGGAASWVSHWHWGAHDSGPGHCFPAGHASAAFAFISGYFALRRCRPGAAQAWLAVAAAAGTLFGVVQQLRGAHFASHTLWTAWICWTLALACHGVFLWKKQHAPAGR